MITIWQVSNVPLFFFLFLFFYSYQITLVFDRSVSKFHWDSKSKSKAIYGKDKTNSSKNGWRISAVLMEWWIKRCTFFKVSLWQSSIEGMRKFIWATVCYSIYHKATLLMQADKSQSDVLVQREQEQIDFLQTSLTQNKYKSIFVLWNDLSFILFILFFGNPWF